MLKAYLGRQKLLADCDGVWEGQPVSAINIYAELQEFKLCKIEQVESAALAKDLRVRGTLCCLFAPSKHCICSAGGAGEGMGSRS